MRLLLSAILSISTCTSAARNDHHVKSHTARALTGDALISALYPVSVKTSGSSGWTTIEGAPGSVPLNDDTLNPRNVSSGVTHPFVTGPEGKSAMEATYPQGSYNFQHSPRGGFSFYAPGPSRVDWTTAREVTLGYSVFFEEGFEFNKGGKLPGLYGGNDPDGSTGCSGGSRSTECFSARLMWRKLGEAELYTYLPDRDLPGYSANKNACESSSGTQSVCNSKYGASTDRGAFYFQVGKWNHVAQRVRLNDDGKTNGEVEIFVNGMSRIFLSGIILQDQSKSSRIRGIDMQTFFGGNDESYASPKEQHAYFGDFSVAITHLLSETNLPPTVPTVAVASATRTTLKSGSSSATGTSAPGQSSAAKHGQIRNIVMMVSASLISVVVVSMV